MANIKPPTWYLPTAQGNSELAAIQNALLPYLSPSGKISAAVNLTTGDPTTFGGYNPADLSVPTSTNSIIRGQYLSTERADRALSAINRMRSLTGTTDESAGYRYLVDTINLLKKYGGPGRGMSRENYRQFRAGVDALKNSAGAENADGYQTLANYFTDTNIPGVGDLKPSAIYNGRQVYGNANKKLFR